MSNIVRDSDIFGDMQGLESRRLRPDREAFPFSRAVLFGASGRARAVRRRLQAAGVEIAFAVDNDPAKAGTEFEGIEVRAPEALHGLSGEAVVIASAAVDEIGLQLDAMGIEDWYAFTGEGTLYREDVIEANADAIQAVYARLADEDSRRAYRSVIRMYQMGDPGCVRSSNYPIYQHPATLPRPGDTVVDAGAFDGDTAFLFRELAGRDQAGDELTVHCFEPEPENFDALVRAVHARGLDHAVIPHKLGLWHERTVLGISSQGPGSRCREGEGPAIQTVRLDDFVRARGLRVDLIKMDIEGAEPGALRGARETIRTQRPRLMICLYHDFKSLWEIPLDVLDMHPGYTLHFGHHGLNWTDSVLYAHGGT